MDSKYSLNGLRILNTRPLPQGKQLSQSIADAGGVSIEFPTIAIEPTTDNWLSAMPDLTKVSLAIFISPNAVGYFFSRLKQQQIAWQQTLKVIAVGNGSAAALAALHIRVDYIPAIADSEHLLQLNVLQQINNQQVLLIKGEGGRPLVGETLLARGAQLSSLAVYRRVIPTIAQEYSNSLWHDDGVDIILFTSQQAMHNLFALFGDNARAWLCSKPCIVISKRLAKEAFSLGITTVLISRHDTLLSSLIYYNQGLIYDN